MIEYQLLDGNGMAEVARERVLELEREHYRLRLLLGEVSGQVEAQTVLVNQLTEIERRHAVHTEPVPVTPPPDGDDTPPAPAPPEPEAEPQAKPQADDLPVDGSPPQPPRAQRRELARASRNGHAHD